MSGTEYDRVFLSRADRLVDDLVARVDRLDPDELEAEEAQGVLKITFADGTKCVLNRQSAAQQVWLAEGASAWHFAFDASRGQWLDTKARGELKSILGAVIAQKLGRAVDLGS